jgi:hypothetical protein
MPAMEFEIGLVNLANLMAGRYEGEYRGSQYNEQAINAIGPTGSLLG